jgi:TonB family protein
MSDSWKECEGQLIDGQFPLLQHLGGSDHSVVFSTRRGTDKQDKAAIKFVQAEAANAPDQLARWKQAAQISHPNLIKLFENGRCQLAGMDVLYVVMEYAQENLAQFLPHRALSPDETRDMLEPFIGTLTHLHGKGFVHGRIKPGNILAIDDQLKLSSDSVCRVGDKQIGAGKPDAYTAPESVDGTSFPAGDVWSLGVTLVESLTQHAPEQKEQGQLVVNDSVPQLFLDIATHSLRNDPKSRWTIAEISARLNPVVAKPIAAAASASAGASASAAGSTSTVFASAVGVAEPLVPTIIQIPASISASALPAASSAPAARSSVFIDPLSVPLSSVAPLSAAAQRTLNYQRKGSGIASSRSYYIVIAILVALTVGALLTVPSLRDRQWWPDTSTVASNTSATLPNAQPANSGKTELAPASEPKPSSQEKQSTPAPQSAMQAQTPQRSTDPGSSSASHDSVAPASERQYVNKDASSADDADSNSSASITAAPLAPAHHAPVAASSSVVPVAPAGSVTQGAVLNEVLPVITAKSRSTIQGTVRVIVKAHVDASGNVTGASPASSSSKFFGDAAVQAVKRWDFSPAKVGGQPAASEWLVRFDITRSDIKVLPAQTKP